MCRCSRRRVQLTTRWWKSICDRLEPLVAEPSMPDKVCTARKAEGVKPGSVFIGSCTNASYSDIARAACILKGHKVHKDIDCTVAPGSRQVLAQLIKDGVLADLVESGCHILECACGPASGWDRCRPIMAFRYGPPTGTSPAGAAATMPMFTWPARRPRRPQQ